MRKAINSLLLPMSIFPALPEHSHSEYDEVISNLPMTKVKNLRILNQLRKYRKARGLKQREAARILGFADGSSLSRWEQGVCLPSVINMFRLAALYRTLVDALYIDALRTIREEIRRRELRMLPSKKHVR
jgi:DNA-binding XRE family transcriptional regulator